MRGPKYNKKNYKNTQKIQKQPTFFFLANILSKLFCLFAWNGSAPAFCLNGKWILTSVFSYFRFFPNLTSYFIWFFTLKSLSLENHENCENCQNFKMCNRNHKHSSIAQWLTGNLFVTIFLFGKEYADFLIKIDKHSVFN